MKRLTSPSTVKELLRRYDLYADKRLGQNFLVDEGLLGVIVRSAAPLSGETVWEVGPGLGTLSRALAQSGANVRALEKDARLEAVLQETLSGLPVRVEFGDALKYDWRAVKARLFVSNLPYNVATPLLTLLLRLGSFEKMVVLLQKEVAERMLAAPGEQAFGLLSLRTAYHASARKVRDFPPSAFFPRPAVTSTLVEIVHNGRGDDPQLFRIIEAAFAHRRKTLRKNLEQAGWQREQILAALAESGIPQTVRAEQLGIAAFQRLRDAL